MTWGYSDVIEPCGECYGFGDTCPWARESSWVTECHTYNTTEGSAATDAAMADQRRLERKYDTLYGCATRCSGKARQRAAVKRLVADLP